MRSRFIIQIGALLMAFLMSMPASVMAAGNDDPMRTSITAGGVVSLVGDNKNATQSAGSDTAIQPTAFVEVDAPLRLKKELTEAEKQAGVIDTGAAKLRVFGRLGISSEPEQTVSILDLKTYKAAVFDVGAYSYFGNLRIVGEAGWSSKLPGSPDPLERVVKHFGAGVGFGSTDDANFTVLYGRDEGAGEMFGKGQIMAYGSVPLKGTAGALWIYGDATINVASSELDPRSKDIFRIGLIADIGATIDALKK